MRIFLVGGFVRDMKFGLYPMDKDYVVTGYTEKELLNSKLFGVKLKKISSQNFPVYHDQKGNEWSLARREQKQGEGYHGFNVQFGPEVTIEADLSRRDLTINSMAIEVFDDMNTRPLEIIDPYGGLKDIENKVLRHTSLAFQEDPVRVLRLARFRARFGPDWVVADETKDLIYKMNKAGILSELTPERIWKEMSRALMEDYPRLFFDTLLQCDVLHILFPELYKLKTALESYKFHPEGEAYSHTMLVITQAARMKYDLETRLACLVHDLGKGATPRSELPKHYGHDIKGAHIAREFCSRLRIPAKIRDRCVKATRYHMTGHRLDQTNPKTYVKMFDRMGLLNDPNIVPLLLRLFICDHRGRLGSENSDISHLELFNRKASAYMETKFNDVFPYGETNVNKIKQELFKARVQAVKSA